jgi:hypothetical protein
MKFQPMRGVRSYREAHSRFWLSLALVADDLFIKIPNLVKV